MIYATLWAIANYHYTVGADKLILTQLEVAARLFPFDHENRLGPARLIIRDHDWENASLAASNLRQVMKRDPNSVFLNAWATELEKKAAYDKGHVLTWPSWPPRM